MRSLFFAAFCWCFMAATPVFAVRILPFPIDTASFYTRHSYDVLNYRLDVDLVSCYSKPFPSGFSANVVITLKADSVLKTIRLNAVNSSIVIDSVRMAGSSFRHLHDTLAIRLSRTYKPGEQLKVRIYYRHRNVDDKGFYSSSGTVFTDSPPEGARKWMPCWDLPSDKATWELFARVPLDVRLGSNGLLTDSVISGNTVRYHWVSKIPVATYLITFTSKVNFLIHRSYWHKPLKNFDSIPVVCYYDPGEDFRIADTTIASSTNFFSMLFGDYPFEKIGFATLNSTFAWGGMEDQSMVNLMPGGYNDANLLVHEHSHQWFGDLITCGTWADIWLNEGFATFSQILWVERTKGKRAYVSGMTALAGYYLRYNPGWPLWHARWAIRAPDANTLYNQSITYNKGACVLYQLRRILGDSMFFKVLQAYATDTSLMFGNALTRDFVDKVNEVTRTDMNWFFNEWVYAPNHPVYANTYDIDSLSSREWRMKFTVNQVQTNTVFFRMPLAIEVDFADGSNTLLGVMNDTNHQDFSFSFDKPPVKITCDPARNILLKEATTIPGRTTR